MLLAAPENIEHALLYDVPWDAYEAILAAMGSRRLRHAYDDGTLEISSRLMVDECTKSLLARLLESASLALNIDIQSIGSTTLKRRSKQKGLEPDECYYVQHEAEVRSRDDYVPERDPPPDLALEVDVTHASLEREPIYAALGVSELWRVKDNVVTFWQLKRGKYSSLSRSLAFPLLTPEVLTSHLKRRLQASETQLVREFVAWVKKESRRKK